MPPGDLAPSSRELSILGTYTKPSATEMGFVTRAVRALALG
jgi:hypothetical protein